MKFAKLLVRKVFRLLGYDIVVYQPERNGQRPAGVTDRDWDIYNSVKPYTMTSQARIQAVIDATDYILTNRIQGDFVECGVWKGGSSMAMALTAQSVGCSERSLYLYDTFEGMSEPTEADISLHGKNAKDQYEAAKTDEGHVDWCYSPIDDVRRSLESTKYPSDRMHFVQGRVEDTIPEIVPGQIALLRLDTDWYESTKHELQHLFPRLSEGGVLIVDDYGHWRGAKKAVDEYFEKHGFKVLLARTDYTGRMMVKAPTPYE